ncbi:MAG: thioredoxin family protein [Bacillota bacterium]|jgi:thioredoxin-like negative regulator of GroEL
MIRFSRFPAGTRWSAVALGMILCFAAFWYLWEARLSEPAAAGTVAEVTPETFSELIEQGKPVVLEFYTNSCPWCEKIEPELHRVSDAHGDKVLVAKMNAEKHWAEASKYELSGVPTLVFFDADGRAVAIAAGYREYAEIAEILRNYKFID